MVQVTTTRFGVLEAKEEDLIHFPLGMLAFEDLKEYLLLPVADNPAFSWLQAVQEPAVAFLLVDPFMVFPGYEVELNLLHNETLQADGPKQVVIYAVVTIPPSGVKDMTANLLGPVAVNLGAKKGLQLVLEGTRYTTRHSLFQPEKPQPAQAASRKEAGGCW
jgi:flagellar assembly factor FliW